LTDGERASEPVVRGSDGPTVGGRTAARRTVTPGLNLFSLWRERCRWTRHAETVFVRFVLDLRIHRLRAGYKLISSYGRWRAGRERAARVRRQRYALAAASMAVMRGRDATQDPVRELFRVAPISELHDSLAAADRMRGGVWCAKGRSRGPDGEGSRPR
jgi:hypothetical protein